MQSWRREDDPATDRRRLAGWPSASRAWEWHGQGRTRSRAAGRRIGVRAGALPLTGEATLRVGAGKVKLATIDRAAIAIGVRFPEAAVIGLPSDDGGEIAAGALVTA